MDMDFMLEQEHRDSEAGLIHDCVGERWWQMMKDDARWRKMWKKMKDREISDFFEKKWNMNIWSEGIVN